MIPFEEIDSRLRGLKKSRAWLAEQCHRKPGSIGDALAPGASPSKRSAILQQAMTVAIERAEMEEQQKKIIAAPPAPDRITIECTPEDRRKWIKASGGDLDRWIVEALNNAANERLGIPTPPPGNTLAANGTDGR